MQALTPIRRLPALVSGSPVPTPSLGASAAGPLSPAPTPAQRPALDPYAPIEKRPLITLDGMKSRGYTVRIGDETTNSGWRECGIVREDYLLVPNRDVRDMAEEIAIRSGHDFVTSRTLFDGKRYSLAITFPFAHAVEVRLGDPVSIGMLMTNAYDGSRQLSASLFVNRLACSNGMVAPQLFGRVRFRHVQRSSGWEEEVARVMQVLGHAEHGLRQFATSAAKLARTQLTARHLKALRSGVFASMPVTLWSRMLDQTLLREEHSLYGLLNGGTAATWHDPRMSVRDVEHNETITRGLLAYAETLS